MRVDIHVHLIPPDLTADMPARAPEVLLADCRTSGAELAVIQGWPFRGLDRCRRQNRWAREAAVRFPEGYRWFCAADPTAGESALAEAAACLDAGCAGVGELDPFRQGFSLDDPVFLRICGLCEERGRPMCLHVDRSVGQEGPGGPLPSAYMRLIEDHPGLRLLLPHYGGGLPFYALMPEVRRHLGNVWFDGAPEDGPLLPQAAECTRLCLGENRLLYGSHRPGAEGAEDACWELPAEWEGWL